MKIISYLVMCIGLVFMIFGYIGIFRFKNFYTRILVSSKADTVGVITILIGIIIHRGIDFFTLKVLIILIFVLLINPIITHSIARSAYMSNYPVQKENEDD